MTYAVGVFPTRISFPVIAFFNAYPAHQYLSGVASALLTQEIRREIKYEETSFCIVCYDSSRRPIRAAEKRIHKGRRKTYRSRLQGRWYLDGDTNNVAEIDADKRGLEARNENGDTTRLDVDRNGDVRARDWHDLRGRVRGNRIEWDNGTTWRRPAV